MTYRELLEKYKAGTLSETEKSKLEEEIEKHEAISDFLYDEAEIPELKDIFETQEHTGLENGKREDAKQKSVKNRKDGEFVSLVNQSIRRAFRRLGMSVLAISIVLILFIQLCLPKLISCFYYNPARELGESNQMSVDMAVYTELLIPCKHRYYVTAEEKGYGKYDFSVIQNISRNGKFTTVSGEITRGKLKYYNMDLLQPPTGNCFVWCQAVGDLSKPLDETLDEQYNMCAAGRREDAVQVLKELDDNQYYIGYVSLNEMMDYEKFVEYIDTQNVGDIWCAVKTTETEKRSMDGKDTFRADNIGFNYSISQPLFGWNTEKYPELSLDSATQQTDRSPAIDIEKKLKSESSMRQHFVSLLTYMSDQESFLKMMNLDKVKYQFAADYVRDNGITVYGFAGVMTKETALQLMEDKEVYEIYTVPYE